MAKTLLNAVNELLKSVGEIHGDSAALTMLTSGSRQRSIDIAIQVVNVGIDELYSMMGMPVPSGQAQSTITLVTGTRSYALASDLTQLRWPFVDRTNNQYILEYGAGYNSLLLQDPEQDDTGLPHYGAINPVNGELHLDRAPDSDSNGRIYTYQYGKDLELDSASDTVPFNNIVFRAMVPVWEQLWRRKQQNDFDEGLYRLNLGRAARLLSRIAPRDNYCNR